VLIWVTGHSNRAAVSRNRYGVEKTVDTHKILINKKSLKIPKGGHQNPYIEEEQTIQWPKEISTKGQTTINKTYT
jgi:hypothetical protein